MGRVINTVTPLVTLAALLHSVAVVAEPSGCSTPDEPGSELRRRPGVESAVEADVACDPSRMATPDVSTVRAAEAIEDRWRLVERLGRPVDLANPYAASNPLKGDRPVFGPDVFFSVGVAAGTLLETRRLPLVGDQQFLSQTVALESVLYKGDTVFRPPDWQWRFAPVVNFSATRSLSGNPSGGVLAVQGLSYERHLRDVSSKYDFDSVRIGIQPLTSDFRGFLLSDQPLAVRVFGTRSNNIFQYNLALAARLPKDRVRLNNLSQRIPNDQILLANVYWQDSLAKGLTSEFVLALNHNRQIAAQAALEGAAGTPTVGPGSRGHDVAYVGYGVDGHVGRLNTTTSLYGVAGRETQGMFGTSSTRVRAMFAASELSMDFDWRRLRLSVLHASGDGDPHDRTAGGFDTLTSAAVFGGSDSSFFFHEALGIAGGAFDLKSRDGFLPSLRPSGNSSESNFSNPGLNLIGIGLDLAISPQLNLSADINSLSFDKTPSLEALLNRPDVPSRIGTELSADAIWRPFATQNLILRLSASRLLSGAGYRALYGDANPFAAFFLITFNY